MKLQNAEIWRPPGACETIKVIDVHVEGEPLRVVVDGYPAPMGDTVLERRQDARQRLDRFRTALMFEPRGHADMYGCLISDPVTPDADFSVLFMHNEGYSSMCGHGIIGIVTVAVEAGMLNVDCETPTIGIDTPAGLVRATAHIRNGRVLHVSFLNVPSFVEDLDASVEVHGIGRVRYDLAFGGAYYAFVRAEDLGVRCRPGDFHRLIDQGMRVKNAIIESRTVNHPFEPDLGFLYGTIIIDEPDEPGSHSRNVCVFANGEVDRSPTGTGVSARASIHHARGELDEGETIVIESLLGTTFSVRVVEELKFGPYEAIVPEVTGSAFITAHSTFILDPEDPLRDGFILR